MECAHSLLRGSRLFVDFFNSGWEGGGGGEGLGVRTPGVNNIH